ncbi:MAG: hypothetical protein EU529_00390 [Promethearchaeota archaeon]|nr:MAG: hypothetical protein EU529_00390 [Candidatus Lokiarchaeota archaeon]
MLKKIAESIRKNENIIEKIAISPIVQYIDYNSFKSSRIFSDIGQDSAAIKDNDRYILVTTDRIKTGFIEKFPFGAGFSSILVSVDDIYACGGIPIAASLIISVKNIDTCKIILEGICEASKKFHVPIIRGHTNPNGICYELSSTMIGEIDKNNYISAINAQINDNIILAVDFDGRIGKASKLYFDTVTFKNSEDILMKRKSMNIIAEKHLANASKDISNGGIFGTILQLSNYSNVGADVNVNKIIIPPQLKGLNYTLEMYIKMYLTTSFILTASDNNTESIIKVFKKYGLEANVIGKIIKQKILKINDGKDKVDVIKF